METTTPAQKSEDAANNFSELTKGGFGDALIPVVAGQKKVVPSIKDWPNHKNTPKDIQEWGQAGHSIGLRTKNFPALDIDTDDTDLVDDVKRLVKHQKGLSYSSRLRGSKTRGRCALVFKTDKPFKKFRVEGYSSLKGAAAVEFLCDGQQVVLCGQHPDGDEYIFDSQSRITNISSINEDSAAVLMSEIETLFKNSGYQITSKPIASVVSGRQGSGSGITSVLTDEEFAVAMDAARHIDNDDRHWDDWVRVGLAIRACAGTDAERVAVAEQVFLDFSEKASKHDPWMAQNKWDSDIDQNYTGAVGDRTLMYEASQSKSGWEEPKPDPQDAFTAYRKNSSDKAWRVIDRMGGPGVRNSTTTPDGTWVDEINSKYAIIDGRSGIQRIDLGGAIALTPVRISDFNLQYRHRTIPVGDPPKPVALGTLWPANARARRYQGVGLYEIGNAPVGHLNLFDDLPKSSSRPSAKGSKSTKSSCARALVHIEDVICDGDARLNEYVLNWIAYKVQNPLEKHGVNLVLIGEQGTGKGTFGQMLVDIFGPRYSSHIQDEDGFLGRFNGHLEGKLFLFVDEAMFGRSPRIVGKYKSRTTETKMQIEHKGVNRIEAPNHFSILICSNNLAAVPVEVNDRRATVLDVSSKRRNDTRYFKEIWDEWDAGGREKFIEQMLQRDLSSFDQRKALHTEAKSEMAAATADPITAFITEIMDNGAVPNLTQDVALQGQDWSAGPYTILNRSLFDAFKLWAKENNVQFAWASDQPLIRRMGQVFPERKKCRPTSGGKRVRGFTYPDLETCRKSMEKRLGG